MIVLNDVVPIVVVFLNYILMDVLQLYFDVTDLIHDYEELLCITSKNNK